MNYEATARSNYFRVKDEAAFRTWADSRGLDAIASDNNVLVAGGTPERLFFISPLDGGPWPSDYCDPETEADRDFDLVAELAQHLHPEDVAVLMEVGYEGSRYVAGVALAVNAQGQTRRVCLDDIYELAKDLGRQVTLAEY